MQKPINEFVFRWPNENEMKVMLFVADKGEIMRKDLSYWKLLSERNGYYMLQQLEKHGYVSVRRESVLGKRGGPLHFYKLTSLGDLIVAAYYSVRDQYHEKGGWND